VAKHTEIRVGDKDWVVRIGGTDSRVKIVSKEKKASGRGYEFVVQRVNQDGRAVGRKLTRGSGALRRPGEAARPAPGVKRAPVPPKKTNVPKSAPKRPRASAAARPSPPPARRQLSSLRGQGRVATAARAPARPQKTKAVRPEYPSQLVKKLVDALKRSDGSDWAVRNVFADVMAKHQTEQRFKPFGFMR
jgi:hypothetical protein